VIMTKKGWATAIGGVLALVLLGAGSCDEPNKDASEQAKQDRAQQAASVVKCGQAKESLECKNLREREKRNSDPNRIGYVYLYNFDGSIKGYFAVKGKVSSTQSQMGPTDDVIYYDRGSYGNSATTVEAPGDDGSYGPNEEGIFFFLLNGGTMVTYSGEYILTDKPLELAVKQLG